jgi:hypothetical protein
MAQALAHAPARLVGHIKAKWNSVKKCSKVTLRFNNMPHSYILGCFFDAAVQEAKPQNPTGAYAWVPIEKADRAIEYTVKAPA